jgi:L-ascorbate metabolism protein UlaG (beta-lactamase superfamily)
VVASAFASPRAGANTLTATWVGHSTTLLQLGPLNVLTDPIWSERASPVSWAGPARLVPPPIALDALPPIDVVLVSHDHYDHLDHATVRRLAQRHAGAAWFAPLGVAARLRQWGVPRVVELDWWGSASSGPALVSCVPARHFSGRTPWDRARTLWAGWTISAHGWRVYFAGDTAYHPEFTRIAERHGPFDLVLMPVGAYEPRWFMGSVHMNPDEALQAYRDVIAAHPAAALPPMLPVHWGTFRLTDEPMQEPPERTAQVWHDAGLDAATLWLLAHGETRRRETRA